MREGVEGRVGVDEEREEEEEGDEGMQLLT